MQGDPHADVQGYPLGWVYRSSMQAPKPIDFWFDFSSPYSYITNEWIDALAARHGRTVQRHAILLGAIFPQAGLKPLMDYPIKADYARRDILRSARFERVPFSFPEIFPQATQNAARVCWWLAETDGQHAAAQWARTVMRAYFTRGELIKEPGVLRALAAEAGLDADAAESAWNDPHWKDRLRQANDDAIKAGVFGAPYVLVDGEPFWGNDRKPQMERWLAEGPF